jgi:hypothetical protein
MAGIIKNFLHIFVGIMMVSIGLGIPAGSHNFQLGGKLARNVNSTLKTPSEPVERMSPSGFKAYEDVKPLSLGDFGITSFEDRIAVFFFS